MQFMLIRSIWTKKFHLNDAKPVISHGEYLGIGKKLGTFGYSVKKKKKKSKKETVIRNLQRKRSMIK